MNDFSILIGGFAGQGSRKAGLIIGKILAHYGYRIFIYEDYQSLIRGGHNFSLLRVSLEEKNAIKEKIDFLIALNEDTILRHFSKLKNKKFLIYDRERVEKDYPGIKISAKRVVKKFKGKEIMENSAFIAGLAKVLGINWKTIENVFLEEFKKFAEINLKIAKEIYKLTPSLLKIKKIKKKRVSILTGNQAVALGAIKAGLEIYYGYPMTPSTSILNFLAENEKKFKIKVIHPENELAVINMALGSAYAGKRTMVGTSGGGFALMTEALSLACQAEIPIVIVESQRMAPSTGVPTYSGQGDLLFTSFAGHGDIVRFVIAPSDANEAFIWSGRILNLAWKYQTPAILLLDKNVSESEFSFDLKNFKKIKKEKLRLTRVKKNYKRYQFTKDGISPLSFPGGKFIVKVNSYEHDEYGFTTEKSFLIEKMQNKRLLKFKEMEKEVEKLDGINEFGKKNSKIALISWGSTGKVVKEVAEDLKIKAICPIILQPFPKNKMKKILKGVERLILIEENGLAQLEKILLQNEIKVDKKILKYTGRPFTVEELKRSIYPTF